MFVTHLETPLKTLLIKGDEAGVSVLVFTERRAAETQIASLPPELCEAKRQLQAYFLGHRKQFDFRLNPSGTAFQKRVWEELRQIPFGTAISYLDLAKRLGDPKVIRAAASANGKNPLSIVVPCHRVVGSDGSLTGYAGGLWRKKWLLEHEGVLDKQQRLF